MMAEGWTLFDKRRMPTIPEPLVTLQKGGNFSYNQAAHQGLGEPEVLEFFYNERERKIGFKKGDPAAPHVYPVRKQRNSSNYQFSGAAFTKSFGIKTNATLRFKAEKQGDMLVIDLDGPAGDYTRNRKQESDLD
jgi:hypothetical protein